jgi:hypothetical protein
MLWLLRYKATCWYPSGVGIEPILLGEEKRMGMAGTYVCFWWELRVCWVEGRRSWKHMDWGQRVWREEEGTGRDGKEEEGYMGTVSSEVKQVSLNHRTWSRGRVDIPANYEIVLHGFVGREGARSSPVFRLSAKNGWPSRLSFMPLCFLHHHPSPLGFLIVS